MSDETSRQRRRREAMEGIVAAGAIEDFADDVADDLRRADYEIVVLRRELGEAVALIRGLRKRPTSYDESVERQDFRMRVEAFLADYDRRHSADKTLASLTSGDKNR